MTTSLKDIFVSRNLHISDEERQRQVADDLDRINDNYGHCPTEKPPEASGTGSENAPGDRAIIKDPSLVPPGPGQNALNLPTAPPLDSEGEQEDLTPMVVPDPRFSVCENDYLDIDIQGGKAKFAGRKTYWF